MLNKKEASYFVHIFRNGLNSWLISKTEITLKEKENRFKQLLYFLNAQACL
jgi:hypothetical protein